ncbi:acyltransferase family protein [Nocardioides sp.]|uniref:acyltransferase family protein n=1 Tax=Nocardioides sp. TaxID=35761 RepID=UPI002B271DA3|nr:acyltransferase family protein [Nocardioides sp.]
MTSLAIPSAPSAPSAPAAPALPSSPTRERLRWPDVAKGASILLVVLHHLVVKDYLFLVAPAFTPIADAWHGLSYGLKPVRMPLFFVVSGFFAAGAVARPWRASWRRIVSSYYLYLVWLTVFIGIYAVERDLPANRVTSVADLLGELVWAASSMWFLYALAVYFVIAKVFRPLPPVAVVAAAAVLAASVSWLGIEENNRFSVLLHLVYFLVGAYFPQFWRSLAVRRVSVPALLALTVAYSAAAAFVFAGPLPWSLGAVGASVLGIPLGILLAARWADSRVGEVLAWVGQRTLRVYVLHLVVLVALVQLPIGLGEGGLVSLVATATYPIVMSGVIVAGCFGLHHVLVRLGAGWLFELPRALDRRLAAAASPPVGTGDSAPADRMGRAASEKVPSQSRAGTAE